MPSCPESYQKTPKNEKIANIVFGVFETQQPGQLCNFWLKIRVSFFEYPYVAVQRRKKFVYSEVGRTRDPPRKNKIAILLRFTKMHIFAQFHGIMYVWSVIGIVTTRFELHKQFLESDSSIDHVSKLSSLSTHMLGKKVEKRSPE